MSTIFTKIIEREIPGQFVYEDEECVVIMDAFPAVPGQSLVILKREVDYVFDLTDKEYNHLFAVAKKIAKASDEALETERTCLVVEGFEVPHVHIKLYPISDSSNYSLNNLKNPGTPADSAELQKIADKIKAEL